MSFKSIKAGQPPVLQAPGKQDCLIIDLVGATGRQDLLTINKLFELSPESLERSTVLEVIESLIRRPKPVALTDKLVAEAVNLFRSNEFHWLCVNPSRFVLSPG